MKQQKGFTLIEVLVALGILVFAMMALMQSISSAARHTYMLDQHTQGYMLASNKLVELQVFQQWPKVGTQTTQETVNGEKWRVDTIISEGPYPGTRRVDIEVGPVTKKKDDWEPVYHTLTMLGGPATVIAVKKEPTE
ncbi:MAG TPA: type II secretion system minor pseudopilin GspI [Alcanivoracaceae bacterium]|nr:type II secretion system minor pseudopilin GspI [Alcanivoracaceae bacterium]